eukprot:3933364-Prymnesium_polylepis.1
MRSGRTPGRWIEPKGTACGRECPPKDSLLSAPLHPPAQRLLPPLDPQYGRRSLRRPTSCAPLNRS